MSEYRTALFDVDGTLLDSTELIYQAYEHTLERFGYALVARARMAEAAGESLEACYRNFTGSSSVEELCRRHREFQQANPHLVAPFAHTLLVLTGLIENGIQTGAVSTRSEATLYDSLNTTGLSPHLGTIVSGSDVANLKPHPEPILLALEQLGAPIEGVVMVGDSIHDVESGKRAGVATVGATYGFSQSFEGSQPDYTIDDIAELLPLFRILLPDNI